MPPNQLQRVADEKEAQCEHMNGELSRMQREVMGFDKAEHKGEAAAKIVDTLRETASEHDTHTVP